VYVCVYVYEEAGNEHRADESEDEDAGEGEGEGVGVGVVVGRREIEWKA